MNSKSVKNFAKVKYHYFFLPIALLIIIFSFLFYNKALENKSYIDIQKGLFLMGNDFLSDYPLIMNNLTQLGDGLIILSFLTILLVFAPKCWECFINAFIVSGIFTLILKPMFGIQRPAAALIHEKFVIIGPKLAGNNSFPSGHSITTFTILAVILFAFMPTDIRKRIFWTFCVCCFGLLLISTRIGVGAHYPIDVITGAIVGYMSAIIGIMITQKVRLWNWIENVKMYPIIILLLLGFTVGVIFKILDSPLIIFYLALLSLLISLFVTAKTYAKQNF